MTETQEIKMQLLDKFGITDEPKSVEFCREAYKFLSEGETKQAPASTQATEKSDGIYLAMADGTAYLFDGETPSETVVGNLKGIGVKRGSWALVVALHDAADGEETTLTTKKGSETYKGYIDDYVNAVADWNGQANTEHLKAIGLNSDIALKEGKHIPSLGEMYFIYMNLKAINAALKAVGGTPIARDWYWTSTEYSATNAWYLSLSSGCASDTTEASDACRVRPVSAFIS